MSGELSALRDELVASLASVDSPVLANVYNHLPGRLAYPAVYIISGSPYITQGQTLGERTVRFEVIVCVMSVDNDSSTSALDGLIEAVQAALEADGWLVEMVSQWYAAEANNAQGLVTSITVAAPVTFNS